MISPAAVPASFMIRTIRRAWCSSPAILTVTFDYTGRASHVKKARQPPTWEPEEEQQLRQMVEAGKSVTLISLRLKRTEMAVRQRLNVLKISLFGKEKNEPAEPG